MLRPKMDVLGMFSANGTFERKMLRPPTSRSHVPKDMSLLDAQLNTTAKTIKKGTDYVVEYVEKEEKELLELAKYCKVGNENNFEAVSQGTVSMQNENNEKAVKIYETYNFNNCRKTNLTITSERDRIVSMIETNSVVVIQGPTGSGKTTQVPQFILDSCYRQRLHCNIIVTQPRRIAAISIAKQVSRERNWPLGTLVGYQVGLINHTCEETRLNYCTTGVLLHKLINSKNMLDYTHIILDEVHERDQDMDFLLLVVRKLLRTNSSSVKVILMSATFEVERFAKYFSSPVRNELVPAPIVDIPKKNYFNVVVYYLCQMSGLGPLPEVSDTEPTVSKRMIEFCVNLIKILDDIDMKADDANVNLDTNVYERHVILVFLPGINEIEETYNLLTLPRYEKTKWNITILHSLITNEEQQQIFVKPPCGYRRIILSTNIAESSITVPDVKYVIDFCLTKQLVVNPNTNIQCLELRWASKVNCEQRAGRAGRVMDGRVYRLVPQSFYESVLPREVSPEMLRAPLSNLILQSKLLDMGEPKAILALSLDPPDLENLESTVLLLKEAGALIDKSNEIQRHDGELTDLGRIMANLPLDIHVTKLIMLGHVFSVLKDTIIIAASLTVKDMFHSSFRQKLLSYNYRFTWANRSWSDCIAFLTVYKVWVGEKTSRSITSDAAEKKWATKNFLQIRVLREIKALVSELTSRLERLGIRESAGVNKVVWKETERSVVLKIAIAGAFYPNYFIKHGPKEEADEQVGVKLLGGLDPSNTVYIQGWPLKQPGILYARRIENIFKKNVTSNVEKIKVSFDSSSRIYVQFIERRMSKNENDDTLRNISSSVYKAIRMRQCNIPLEIPILNDHVAVRRVEEMNLKETSFFTREKFMKDSIRPRLPALRESRIPVAVQNVIDPGCFWIQIRDYKVKGELERIQSVIKRTKHYLHQLATAPEIGSLVIAPYEQNNCTLYCRAVVKSHITYPEILVQVFCIDYGYSTECRLRDLIRLDCDSDIANIPALAIECVLANVRSSVAYNSRDSWPATACDFFQTLINKPGLLFGDIYSVVNGVVALELIHRRKDEEEEIIINKCLIDEGFAKNKEENCFSQFNHNLRSQESNLSDEQCRQYEKLQHDIPDVYPEPPDSSECYTTINLRGPFSPLEIELKHLVTAARDKTARIAINSVNSVLLDTDLEDPNQRLLVATSVSQNVHGNKLTLYNTTLMPRLPGLTALITLIFTPCMELRRNTLGTRYVGALCGLGFDPVTKESIFPEHDIQLEFDAEITIEDLQYVNRLRHWMNIGMQINHHPEINDNREENSICQNRIKDALLKLIEKPRKSQSSELIQNFNRWNLYDESLHLLPGRLFMIANNIYRLHNALELEEMTPELEMTEHLRTLRSLITEDPRKPENANIPCKLCEITLNNIVELRGHLFTAQHKEKEERLRIQV
ncbi:probable ATP-dependent RNA helicase spindle-E isoform X2 [Colletes gigas]|nr:probable ATP-dependent RNA helicase spindle-E isoform X2 [Colletes gigas]